MGFFSSLSDILFKTMDYAMKEADRQQKEQDRAEAKMATKSDSQLSDIYKGKSTVAEKKAASQEFSSRVEAEKAKLGKYTNDQQLKSIAKDESKTLSERKAAYEVYKEKEEMRKKWWEQIPLHLTRTDMDFAALAEKSFTLVN